MNEARTLACTWLRAVLRKGTALEEAMASSEPVAAKLSARDRAFARRLVATTLRRLGQIDAALAGCLNQSGFPKPAVHDLLRLGAAQILFLNTPPHAAVDTTLALARAGKLTSVTGLLNAVLRRLAREGTAQALTGQDAARLNTPGWLWQSWCAAYGVATAHALATAHLEEAPLDITLRDSDPATHALWAERLDARILPTGSLRRPAGGRVTALPGYDEGAWWVQDAMAAIPARLLGTEAGQQVIDLCAAPGGKTAQLAAAGARVTAVDHSPTRLVRLRENMQRLRLSADIVQADASQWQPETPADAVLLDAPCSATGTIRRHPDIPHLKTAADIVALSAVQTRLLHHAATLLRPGGVLVYATCSLQPEEGEALVARVLAEGAPLELEPLDPDQLAVLLGPQAASSLSPLITPAGTLRARPDLWPELGGLDGFFAARLRRHTKTGS